MPKSTKNQDKLASYDEFRAPWETATGDEAEIDKPKLKRFIFNLMVDKAKAQDARDDSLESVTLAESERDEAREQAANASPEEAQKQIAKLTKERDDLKAQNDKFIADKAEAELRAEVLGDLDAKYAKYVQGSTKEELEESLKSVKEDFGLSGDGAEDEDDEPTLRTRPRTSLRNSGDPEPDHGADGFDADKIADQILQGNALFR